MLRATFANIAGHRRRLVGTLVAIVAGVAFLSGTLVLGDTLRANFDRLLSDASAGTDAIVRAPSPFTSEATAGRPVVDEALGDTLRAANGVASVEGVVQGYGRIIGRDGDGVGGGGPPTFAGSWIEDPELNPYRIAEGRPPESDTEVVINRGAAKDGDLAVGDRTIVQVPEPVEVTIVGISTFGGADGVGPVTFAAFTLRAAQEHVLGGAGQVNEFVVKAQPGVSQEELTTSLETVVPDGVEVVTGAVATDEQLDDIRGDFLDMFSALLVVFGAIGLGVATFSIHNTFSILVAQRTRESALFRALGASRGQILGSVAVEALAVGVVATAIGAAAGIGVAAGLLELFHAFGFPLPGGGTTVSTTSVAVAGAVGVVVTVVAALSPAVRASRVHPLAALRDVAVEQPRPSRTRVLTGVTLVAGGVALVLTGGATFGVGAIAVVVGAIVLGPVFARPVAAALGAPLPGLRGITGALARGNAMRNPRRTAGAATALVVGVGVVSLVTVMLASLSESTRASYERSFGGDLAITSGAFGGDGGFSPGLAADIDTLPEVDRAVGLGFGEVLLDADRKEVSVADPAAAAAVLDLGVVDGSLADLGEGDIAVSRDAAEANGWDVGASLAVTYPDGVSEQLTVGAIYDDQGPMEGYLLPRANWAPHAPQDLDSTVLVSLAPGLVLDAGRAAVTDVAEAYGASDLQDRQQYVDEQASAITDLLGIVYVLLALSVLIALLGIANTLALSVHERTRELGLLRAVGQTANSLRSMIRWEAAIVAVFGTVVGLALGLFLGWGLVRELGADIDIDRFSVPPTQLLTIVVVGAIAGLVAGARPARRAARLRLLDALAAD